MDITITIPVFNQLHYTKQCLESLNRSGVNDSQIVIVNNASTDGTKEFLATRPQLRAVHNEKNLGCGAAWSQGAQASVTQWTVVMNNDVLVPVGCLEGLVACAEQNHLDIVSPAMREGPADYDVAKHAAKFMPLMAAVRRGGEAHGVCFMVHRRVFDAIGYFDSDPKLGGYEDDEFFRRAGRAKFHMATTGRGFIHHFGSITQKAMKLEQSRPASLGDRDYYRRKTGQTWFKRKTNHVRNHLCCFWWRNSEKLRYGHSLWESCQDGSWIHR